MEGFPSFIREPLKSNVERWPSRQAWREVNGLHEWDAFDTHHMTFLLNGWAQEGTPDFSDSTWIPPPGYLCPEGGGSRTHLKTNLRHILRQEERQTIWKTRHRFHYAKTFRRLGTK